MNWVEEIIVVALAIFALWTLVGGLIVGALILRDWLNERWRDRLRERRDNAEAERHRVILERNRAFADEIRMDREMDADA